MEEESFEFVGKREEIQRIDDIKEDVVELEPGLTEKDVIDMAEKKKTHLFARIFKPKPSEVEYKGVKKHYVPYWYLGGSYSCRWLNITNYPVPVPEDVEAVKIGDNVHTIRRDALKLGDVLERMGIGFSIGIMSVPMKGLSEIPGLDKTMGIKKHVLLDRVIELREDKKDEEICVDEDGNEDKETHELIKKARSIKAKKHETPKLKRDFAVEELWKNRFKEADKTIESDAEGIIERKFEVKDIKIVLVPYYEVAFEKGGETKSYSICAVDGAMAKI